MTDNDNHQLNTAKALYSRMAATYDEETRYIKGIREAAIAALALKPGDVVLDAGCGTGWCVPKLIAGVGPSGHAIGFEPSPEMLAIAQHRVDEQKLSNVTLIEAAGENVRLPRPPNVVLFSYTHDLMQSREALTNLFSQVAPGARVVAASTKLFPSWFFLGNWYLRWSHRVTITNFNNFDAPWRVLAEYCDGVEVMSQVPGSRYIFTGRVRALAR
jgi:ubiquinone/menaquinone biosynthesis C-methylase UbiE